jgi:hypothetical protein
MNKIRQELNLLSEQTKDNVPLDSYKWILVRIALLFLAVFVKAISYYVGEKDDTNIS